MRGADLLVQTLAKAGVDTIFTLSGNQIMPIFDACLDAGIRLVHARHEGACGFMADAYAQVTGKPGIALVTAAPGFANGLGPLYSARSAESPVILMSGDSPRAHDGMGAFQELDQVRISEPLTKLSFRPRAASALGEDMAQALRAATAGRPGPVHMALPFDLLNEEVGEVDLPSDINLAPETVAPDADTVGVLTAALRGASRPVILTGPVLNPSRAVGLLDQLADAADAPVVPLESPRGLNDPCLGRFAETLAKADVIVSLGKYLDFTTGFAQPPAMSATCRFLVVDPDAMILGRARRALGARLRYAARADSPAAAETLIAAMDGGDARAEWRREMAEAVADRTPVPAESGDGPMHPATLCVAVQRLLDAADDPILIVDGGEFGQWAQACINAPTRVINGPSGAIGGALCYAVGVKTARPNATVVVLMGDGTVGFHFAEFETAHRYGADFTCIVGNDARWNAEVLIQMRDYGPDRVHGCELNPTRYDLAAAGFGCHGEHVDDPAVLDAALKRADESGLPALVNVAIDGQPAPSGVEH